LLEQLQSAIGWERLVDVWLSEAWQEHQEQFWCNVRTWHSSKRWTMALIKKLWNIVWDMWEQHNDALDAEAVSSQSHLR